MHWEIHIPYTMMKNRPDPCRNQLRESIRESELFFPQNQETKVITAVQVYENSPANEAGIQVNDILYKVGDKDVGGTDLSDVASSIRGVENTTVDITVLRGDDAKEVTMTVTRRKSRWRQSSSK